MCSMVEHDQGQEWMNSMRQRDRRSYLLAMATVSLLRCDDRRVEPYLMLCP